MAMTKLKRIYVNYNTVTICMCDTFYEHSFPHLIRHIPILEEKHSTRNTGRGN
jgi:hypothetical protein